MSSPHDQSQYQVRFDWGVEGARVVSPGAEVVVLVDVLESSDAGSQATEWPDRVVVIAGSLRNRTAVAEWVLARQAEKGDRFAVAVIAAGEARGGGNSSVVEGRGNDSGIRFAVEDQLGAGAIIDALAAVGLDYCSPEAAAACASFTGLRGAVGHLVSASASGKELAQQGGTAALALALAVEVDASKEVLVLKEYGGSH